MEIKLEDVCMAIRQDYEEQMPEQTPTNGQHSQHRSRSMGSLS